MKTKSILSAFATLLLLMSFTEAIGQDSLFTKHFYIGEGDEFNICQRHISALNNNLTGSNNFSDIGTGSSMFLTFGNPYKYYVMLGYGYASGNSNSNYTDLQQEYQLQFNYLFAKSKHTRFYGSIGTAIDQFQANATGMYSPVYPYGPVNQNINMTQYFVNNIGLRFDFLSSYSTIMNWGLHLDIGYNFSFSSPSSPTWYENENGNLVNQSPNINFNGFYAGYGIQFWFHKYVPERVIPLSAFEISANRGNADTLAKLKPAFVSSFWGLGMIAGDFSSVRQYPWLLNQPSAVCPAFAIDIYLGNPAKFFGDIGTSIGYSYTNGSYEGSYYTSNNVEGVFKLMAGRKIYNNESSKLLKAVYVLAGASGHTSEVTYAGSNGYQDDAFSACANAEIMFDLLEKYGKINRCAYDGENTVAMSTHMLTVKLGYGFQVYSTPWEISNSVTTTGTNPDMGYFYFTVGMNLWNYKG